MAITPISTFREFASDRPDAERVILKSDSRLKAKTATNKLLKVWNKVATGENNYDTKQMFINSIRQEYGSKIGAIMDRTISLKGRGDLSSRQISQALDFADILKQNKEMRHDIYNKSAPKPKYDNINNQWVQTGVVNQKVNMDEHLSITHEQNNKKLNDLLDMSSDFLDPKFMSTVQAELSGASKMAKGGNHGVAKQILDDCTAKVFQELTKKIMAGNEDSEEIQKLNHQIYEGFKTGDLNKARESLKVLHNKLNMPGSGQDDAPIAFDKLPDQPRIDQDILTAGADEFGDDPDDISWQPEGGQLQQPHEELPDQPKVKEFEMSDTPEGFEEDFGNTTSDALPEKHGNIETSGNGGEDSQ